MGSHSQPFIPVFFFPSPARVPASPGSSAVSSHRDNPGSAPSPSPAARIKPNESEGVAGRSKESRALPARSRWKSRGRRKGLGALWIFDKLLIIAAARGAGGMLGKGGIPDPGEAERVLSGLGIGAGASSSVSRAILNPGLRPNPSPGSNPSLEKRISQEIWAPSHPPPHPRCHRARLALSPPARMASSARTWTIYRDIAALMSRSLGI